MSADSSQVYVLSAQRRFLRIALAIAVLFVFIATPLLINGTWRLNLAHRLGMAPGENVEQVAGPNSGQTLIVIPIFVATNGGRDEVRFQAAYLAKPKAGTYALTSLDDGRVVPIPLERLDFISADRTGEHLLFRQEMGLTTTSVLLTTGTGVAETLPDGQSEPELPGEWTTSVFAQRIGRTCQGISPQQTYIACFTSPTFARFLAGDWQIEVRKYGEYRLHKEIFRGEGTQPVFGFTADETWLYFQNENGIWREPMRLDMFGK